LLSVATGITIGIVGGIFLLVLIVLIFIIGCKARQMSLNKNSLIRMGVVHQELGSQSTLSFSGYSLE